METSVEACKASAIEGMERFLKNFSFVPDDKLTWTPTPTAKSALRIAAHTALYPARFARMINERKLPKRDNMAEWLAQREREECAITDRAEVEVIFRKGTDEFLAALDTLTPEAIAMNLDSGFGSTFPMTFIMKVAGLHAIGHAGQIDYIQTCWDDQEVHF